MYFTLALFHQDGEQVRSTGATGGRACAGGDAARESGAESGATQVRRAAQGADVTTSPDQESLATARTAADAREVT